MKRNCGNMEKFSSTVEGLVEERWTFWKFSRFSFRGVIGKIEISRSSFEILKISV